MDVTVILQPVCPIPDETISEAFWLADSPSNRALADRLYARGGADPNSAVFKSADALSFSDRAIDMFHVIAEHHPDWVTMTFPGLEPGALLALAEEEGLEVEPCAVDARLRCGDERR